VQVRLLQVRDLVHQQPVLAGRRGQPLAPGEHGTQVARQVPQLRGADVGEEASVHEPADLRLHVRERGQQRQLGRAAQRLVDVPPDRERPDHVVHDEPRGVREVGTHGGHQPVERLLVPNQAVPLDQRVDGGEDGVVEERRDGGVRRAGEPELVGVRQAVGDLPDR
jgi:hypothetical protein